MHGRVQQIIGHPVVGELFVAGEALWTGAWGRVCLPQVGEDEVQALERAFVNEGSCEVRRVGLLGPSSAGLPGLLALELRHPELGRPYTLQIGTAALFELLERRFWLAPDVLADLAGAYVAGLRPLATARPEGAFGRVAQLQELGQRFDESLAQAGQGRLGAQLETTLGYLVAGTQRAAGLLPWTLRKRLATRWLPPRPIGALQLQGDLVGPPILVVALRAADGQLAKQQLHRQTPQLESVEQVERWSLEVLQLKQEFSPPEFHCVAACASSLTQLLENFPRHRPPFGSPPERSQ